MIESMTCDCAMPGWMHDKQRAQGLVLDFREFLNMAVSRLLIMGYVCRFRERQKGSECPFRKAVYNCCYHCPVKMLPGQLSGYLLHPQDYLAQPVLSTNPLRSEYQLPGV